MVKGATQGQNVYTYVYDKAGNCTAKTINGVSTMYMYDPLSLNLLTAVNGKAVHYIYLNGKQVAKVERKDGIDKKYFYHTDHLGSTRAITDGMGAVAGRFEYQPFGLEENTVQGDDTLTFTGKMQDNLTRLMYFNVRYYDPTLGRFITEDPAKDGDNWYIYCINNPLGFMDLTGESVTTTISGVVFQNYRYKREQTRVHTLDFRIMKYDQSISDFLMNNPNTGTLPTIVDKIGGSVTSAISAYPALATPKSPSGLALAGVFLGGYI